MGNLLRNAPEIHALAFFHALAAVALLCFCGYLSARLRPLTRHTPALLAGGAIAAVCLLLSALLYRALSEPIVARDPALTHALLVLSYLVGGPGIALPLAPLTPTTTPRPTPCCSPRPPSVWAGWRQPACSPSARAAHRAPVDR